MSYESVKSNLGLKEEWFEVHCRVSHNVHQDGGHVDGHENTQKSSAKDDLGISLKWWKEAKKTHKSVILGQDFKFVDILGFQGFLFSGGNNNTKIHLP